MRVMVIGPSCKKCKGGMATVIQEMENDKGLKDDYEMRFFSSYIDGNKIIRALYTVFSLIYFLSVYNKYDLFHIHMASYGSTYRKGLYAYFIKKKNKKVIIHIHGGEFMVFYEKLNSKRKQQVVELLKNADLVIALSKEWRNRFEKIFALTNCVAINNGVDVSLFNEAIESVEKTERKFLVLGRLGKLKGTYDLIDSAEIAKTEFPDLKIYLAGDGEIEKVKRLVSEKKLDNTIKVLGWVDKKTKIKLLKKTSVLILPSYNEGLPMAILEGMASEKAIISTPVGAIGEIIKDENGILVTPGNCIELGNAIKKCCEDKNMVENMGKCNRNKIIQEYSLEIMHQKIRYCYDNVSS
ncbi:glycosyltransferase family 4 protein [uncultured Robinsoniella sp.]|uniref:glycosyltransferase family 4 protein n=1 Tax=uncultured Robinsoniella sp. TaxID=904190 RepID=UPI00374E2A82